MTINSLRQRRLAAARLLSFGLRMVPVVPCTACGISLPADHTCPPTPEGDPYA